MTDNYMSTDKDPVVPFSDDEAVRDDELIVDEDKPGISPEEKKARAERRKERAQQRERERKEQAEELKKLRERDEQRERELAELRGAVSRQHQPAPPAEDPFKARLEALSEKQLNAHTSYQAELAAAGGKLSEARARYWHKTGLDLEEERTTIFAERAVAQKAAREEPVRLQEQAMQVWRNQYPDVYGNPDAYKYAYARVLQRTSQGERHTDQMNHEVFQEARAQFKLGPKPAPTATEKARLSGTASSGGGGGGGGAAGIQMTRDFKKMAEAMYSDLTPEKAHQKWVDEVGKPLRARKVI